ncbi:hypothetical protein [Lysobacter sp. CA199]|uniref:hypothetical protein n=1 Tax=Lysobacter sp. CA199 TaxID=3455608 RepID=UPI003F8D59F6
MSPAVRAAPFESQALKLSAWLAVACLVVPLLGAAGYQYWLRSTGAGDGFGMMGLFFVLGTAAIEVPLLIFTVIVLVTGVVDHLRNRRAAKSAPGSTP